MKVVVHSLGCRVNQYEAQFLREALQNLPGEGEVHVVNTCTVTVLADRKARQLIARLRREHPQAWVVAVGCGADGSGEGLRRAGAHLVVGNKDKAHLPEILARFLQGETPTSADWPDLSAERVVGPFPRARALLKVQDGCTVGCTFCRTWQVRGPLRSKPPEAARAEAQGLAQRGHREIVVVGVNLAQYGEDLPQRPSLIDLLRELLGVEGVRFRLSSLNPEGVSEGLVELFAREPRLCPYLHMPLQSGDDEVLRRMGRPYTAEFYRTRARLFLQTVPNATLGTDVLVGFPGEDEAAFRRTVELLEELEPLNVHVFRFSPRPGTPAAQFPHRLEPRVVAHRARELAARARVGSARVRQKFVGHVLHMVVEEVQAGGFTGHTENYIEVHVPGAAPPRGTIVAVRLIEVDENIAKGVIVHRQKDE